MVVLARQEMWLEELQREHAVALGEGEGCECGV